MPGPPPKPREQRRRRNPPAGGEWVDLEPLERPVLPGARPGWSAGVRRLWKAWRHDPVTALYGPADVAWALELADRWDDLEPAEQRLRVEGLGLSPKGRRNLRWRAVTPPGPPPAPSGRATVTPIRAV